MKTCVGCHGAGQAGCQAGAVRLGSAGCAPRPQTLVPRCVTGLRWRTRAAHNCQADKVDEAAAGCIRGSPLGARQGPHARGQMVEVGRAVRLCQGPGKQIDAAAQGRPRGGGGVGLGGNMASSRVHSNTGAVRQKQGGSRPAARPQNAQQRAQGMSQPRPPHQSAARLRGAFAAQAVAAHAARLETWLQPTHLACR